MDALAWIMLVVGVLAGGGIGFALGRLTASTPAIARAVEREDAADAQADRDRQAVQDDLAERLDETRRADAEELKRLLDADFAGPGSQPVQPDAGKPADKP